MKTLLPYVGGKARQALWICSHIDATPHQTYLEPFCGSGAVFFAKRPSKIEILNDLDDRFPLLFQAVRDHQEELIDYCSWIEYSKAAFDESYHHLRDNPDNLPEWKLGAWALYQVMASFSGWPDGHSFAVRVKGCNPAQTWARKVGQLGPYAERLRDATITNGDGIRVIKQYDKVDVLQYVDPPYVGAEHRYKVAKEFDHKALAKALHGLQHAKVILSHYHCEPYLTFYGNWRCECMPSTQSCKGATIHSPTGAKPVVESLWFNW